MASGTTLNDLSHTEARRHGERQKQIFFGFNLKSFSVFPVFPVSPCLRVSPVFHAVFHAILPVNGIGATLRAPAFMGAENLYLASVQPKKHSGASMFGTKKKGVMVMTQYSAHN